MKKAIFFLAFMMLSSGLIAQKHWTFGLNGGIPIGDVEDTHTFHASADVAYRIDIINLLDIGGMIGYSRYFGDSITEGAIDIDYDDLQFLPIAANGRLRILAILFAGTDIGYAIGISDDNDGGFYIRPQVGINLGIANVLASYENISVDGGNVSSINAGLELKF
ncbi:hypothetical protein [Gramella sp. MT6]|uniref:hypothetical protein n=1 Tax=Gramella sp. MT6 TaxID=2705471 RepID=UPI001C5DD22F|nr:hypothetical protein [Gramella sp. MT6]